MAAGGMARRSKHEYLGVMWQRYQQADRATRSALLDGVTRVCGYHRKYAIGLLSRAAPPRTSVRRVSRRRPTYGEPVIRLLAEIWAAAGYLCGQRLKAALPHWLPWLKRRATIMPTVERQLVRISARQMDRRLAARKRWIKRRLYGTTRPGSLLKHLIPIKTDQWDVTKPGYLEIDLVSHSGASAAGEFLHTLDGVDIHTTWVERQAVMGKSRHEVVQAMVIRNALIADKSGRVIAWARPPQPELEGRLQAEWLRGVAASAERTIGPVLGAPVQTEHAVATGYPIRDDERDGRGGPRPDRPSRGLGGGVRENPAAGDSVITITDADSVVVARRLDSSRYVGRRAEGAPSQSRVLRDVPSTDVLMGLDGIERAYGNAVVARGPWLASVGIPTAVARERTAPIDRRNFIIMVAAFEPCWGFLETSALAECFRAGQE